ncbi:MAG: hypothetical protein M1819_005358 [Sarea resinae]|nr:MAG: hypothetical protein M1819_005358 [Sarea resinae]
MSRRQFKSQASSSRASPAPFGGGLGSGFSAGQAASSSAFGATASPLSYITEPPDLASISEPNVIVAFKNLTKKDSTTKAKALEELSSYISALDLDKSGVEESVLEAWIKIYPRSSIDSSRRVRQLAQTLQGQISVACGKRLARHMPRVVGAWLAGLYDPDRTVARASQTSLKSVFPTEEKLRTIWKAYQGPILEYSRDAVLRESVLTLSDERTVSPDDAEAKYARVVGTSVSVVVNLLVVLNPDEISKQEAIYEELLSESKLWDFASYEDAFVRRTIYRLLRVCLTKQRDIVVSNLGTISTSLISKALASDQIGSSYDCSKALAELTVAYPHAWTDAYKAKKPAETRLRKFLKKGSQAGPPEFWNNISIVFSHMPPKVLPHNLSEVGSLLDDFRQGLGRKDEARNNLIVAWDSYLNTTWVFLENLNSDEQNNVLEKAVLPMFEEFVRPSPESCHWPIGPSGLVLCTKIFKRVSETKLDLREPLTRSWTSLAQGVATDIRVSLPEQSKDFGKSQASVAAEGDRFFQLQAEVLKFSPPEYVTMLLSETTAEIIDAAFDILASRNGKPYGAAAVVATMLQRLPQVVSNNKHYTKRMSSFITEELPTLLTSPSAPYLITILYACKDLQDFEKAWSAAVRILLASPDSTIKTKAIRSLVSGLRLISKDSLSVDIGLEQYVLQDFDAASIGQDEHWPLISEALSQSGKAISGAAAEKMLVALTENLTTENKVVPALHGLEMVAKENPDVIKSFLASNESHRLLSNLLLLTESPDDGLAQQSTDLSHKIEAILSKGGEENTMKASILSIIQKGFSEARPDSLMIESLLERAMKMIQQTPLDERASLAIQLLPGPGQWADAIQPFMGVAPHPSLALTNPLGGAVYLIDRSKAEESLRSISSLPRDLNGYSSCLRMASYTVGLLKEADLSNLLSPEMRGEVFRWLTLIILLTNDNITLSGANHIWSEAIPEAEAQVLDFIFDAQNLLSQWLKMPDTWWIQGDPLRTQQHSESSLDKFIEGSAGLSPSAFYYARAFSTVRSETIELRGWHPSQETPWTERLRLRDPEDTFIVAATLTGFKVPISMNKESLRMCNQLIADLTGLDINTNPEKALRQFILLNLILQTHDGIVDDVPQQRIVFFVKHIIPWLTQDQTSLAIIAEALKALLFVLPLIQGIYGSHWSEILEFIAQLWSGGIHTEDAASLPAAHASLKLFAMLRALTTDEEANDDLKDAWTELADALSKGLMHLLKESQAAVSDESNQPLRMVNEILARQISLIPSESLGEPSELYPLLYVPSLPVQQTAFSILHRLIPPLQESLSIEIALSKSSAHLPSELLSLILSPPSLSSVDLDHRSTPLSLQSYLLSWLLIYDHFPAVGASDKLKSDYLSDIKEGDYLTGLLELLTSILGFDRGKPLDASRFDVEQYVPGVEESPERDTQWLLIHLYYLSLLHCSSLVKTWFISCKSRPKTLSLEPWTEKYISPSIITTALSSVSTWAASQQQHDSAGALDDTDAASAPPLQIKTSPRAREIVASYPIDDQLLTVVIKLPGAFPLRAAVVEGVSRVGVDEKKWRAWLLNAQGAIAFSNNSLPPALSQLRRNITLTLRGHAECSICYSIISAEKQLPNKRCATCKNAFHAGCLWRWFKSSNKSDCPLCRSSFAYA